MGCLGSLLWLRMLRATQLWRLPSLNLGSPSVISLLLLLLWWSLRRMWTSAFGRLGQRNALEHPSSETGPLFPTTGSAVLNSRTTTPVRVLTAEKT